MEDALLSLRALIAIISYLFYIIICSFVFFLSLQDREVAKDNLQSLADPPASSDKDVTEADTKDVKAQKDDDANKSDNDNGDQNDSDDDYDDEEFPPVHIKLPLQLDLDDLAGVTEFSWIF